MVTKEMVIEAWKALTEKNTERALTYFSEDAVVLGGILPDTLPAAAAFQVMKNLWAAMPDFYVTDEAFEVAEDTVCVTFCWGGTHTEKFDLGVPGMPAILPTCKPVLVMDRFDFIVEDDQIVLLAINSPEHGGMPAALRQIGSLEAFTPKR